MAIPVQFRAIPNDVLAQSDLNDLADSWAQDQHAKLATDWASAQNASPPAPPTPSDSLTNPPLAPAPAAAPGDASAPPPDLTAGVSSPDSSAAPLPPAESAVLPAAPPPAVSPPASLPPMSDTPDLSQSASTAPTDGSDPNWLTLAKSQLGKPYIWGSAGGRSDFSPNAAGFDCSGFVSYVMQDGLGIKLPAQTASAYAATAPISADQAKPGDVVLYNMGDNDPHIQHIAIYLGNGQVIQDGGGGGRHNVNIAPISNAGSYEFRRPTGSPNADLVQKQVANVSKSAAPDSATSDTLIHTDADAVGNWIQGAADTVGGAANAVTGAVQGAVSTFTGPQPMAASQQPTPSDTLTNPPQQPIVPQLQPSPAPQPTVFDNIGSSDMFTKPGGTGAPFGGATPFDALTAYAAAARSQPIDLEKDPASILAIAGMGDLKGMGDIADLLAKYTPEEQAAFADFATKMTAAGQKPADIEATVRQWIQGNPPSPPTATAAGGPVMPSGRPVISRGGVPGADVGRMPNNVPPTTDLNQALEDTLMSQGKTPDEIAAIQSGTPAASTAGAATPVGADWPTQLRNLKDSPSFKGATPAQQTQMIADAQAGFASDTAGVPAANPMRNVDPQGNLQPGAQNIPGRQGGAVPPVGAPPGGPPSKIISGSAPLPPPPEAGPVQYPRNITQDMVDAAHQRISDAVTSGQLPAAQEQGAHDQLDKLLASGADPGALERFLAGDVEGKTVSALDNVRTLRTGSMAGGPNTMAKVALSPFVQIAMRAPVAALKAIARGDISSIPAGLQGVTSRLGDIAADALQTARYGVNDRAALLGGAQGGYGMKPGLDVMGSNPLTRAVGAGMTGLVRLHGAAADVSAGIGRSAALGQGASPEDAQAIGQQWALRSNDYGATGQMVSNALEGLKSKGVVGNVAGQILVPFYRVAYNAVTQGVERSPVGLLGRVTDAMQGKPFDTNKLANNLFGVGLAAVGFGQAAQGNITGERPQNGAPAWSIKVAGNWVPIRTLGPAGEAIAQSAALYEAARDGKGDVAKTATLSAGAYVQHVEDETWVQNVASVFSSIGDLANVGNPNANVARTAQSDLAYQGRTQAASNVRSVIPQSAAISQTAKDTGNPDPLAAFLSGVGLGAPAKAATGAPRAPTAPRVPVAPRAPRAP
jgi:cell wall-associated NlpC family hydrolase